MRVLIGYDGSMHSDAAIDDLKFAGLPNDTEALVISVGDLLMSSPEVGEVIGHAFLPARVTAGLQRAQTYADRVTREATEAAAKGRKRVEETFPSWDVLSQVKIGTPAWAVIDAANEWDADLIVVGSHGRSALKRFLLGSVSKTVVTDANTSVRVVRPRFAEPNDAEPKIIIGVDGSPAAAQAIYTAGRRVWPTGTEVILLAVDDSTPTTQIETRLPLATAMINDHFRDKASRVSAMLEWGKTQLNAIGLRATVAEEKGDPSKVILAKAEEWNADTIFVGTRNFDSAFERYRLGSVSTAIVSNATTTVEVVRSDRNVSIERSAHEEVSDNEYR